MTDKEQRVKKNNEEGVQPSDQKGRVSRVSGPLVVAEGLANAKMNEMVRVGEERLFGEIIEIRGNLYSIQVYEETQGIGPGAPVVRTGNPLSVDLGPGLMGSIYDGVQRPLNLLEEKTGTFIARGAEVPAIDREKKWEFVPSVENGAEVVPGDIIGTVQETPLIECRITVPPGIKGKVREIVEKKANVTETVAVVETEDGDSEIQMLRSWPVRHERPVERKIPPTEMLVTGQRVIDTFYPLAKGGTACVPGPFGSGKTVVQHQLAKWADADIIVYVGCGERGNEMTDVLMELPELKDPSSGQPMIERTVLVANTSNMPVAAREASVFTGITIAEYFRDMGYSVALMADSTSRWAEAMREMSGRLEEMPGDEGYPAYLASRIASFYERSGNVICSGSDDRRGSLSLIGAVSPPGGDLSDPVVQSTLRVVQVFWSLEDELASARHFPAISWLRSYSLYEQEIDKWANENVADKWAENRQRAMSILQHESELEELVRLVGMESLSDEDRLLMEVARMIREDFLHQNAFHDVDTYSTLEKQFRLLGVIVKFDQLARESLKGGRELEQILKIPAVEDIAHAKFIDEEKLDQFDKLESDIEGQLSGDKSDDSEPATT